MSGHYEPWVSFEHQAVAAAGALCLGIEAIRRDAKTKIDIPAAATVAICMALIPAIQWLTGLVWFRSDAFLASLYLLGFAACAVVGRRLTATCPQPFLDGLSWALIASALISNSISLLQWLQMPVTILIVDLAPGGRPYGNLGQPNHLATLIALGLFSTLRLFETRRLGSSVAALVATFLGFGIVMTQSRTSWLVAAALIIWWLALRRRAKLRLTGTAISIGMVAFAAATLAWPALNEALALAPAESLGQRGVQSNRLQFWPVLWDAIWRQPLFGYGWGQVIVALQTAAPDHPPIGEWLLQSHNLVLDLLIYNGVAIGVIIAALIVAWLVREARACRTVDQWTLVAAVGVVATHAMLEYPLDYAYFLLPVGLIVGSLTALSPTRLDSMQVPPWALPAAMAILIPTVALVSFEYLSFQAHWRNVRLASIGLRLDSAEQSAADKAPWILDEPFERIFLSEVTPRPGMSTSEFERLRRIAMREPRPPALMKLALAAALNGHPALAQAALTNVCKLHGEHNCRVARGQWAAWQSEYEATKPIPFNGR